MSTVPLTRGKEGVGAGRPKKVGKQLRRKPLRGKCMVGTQLNPGPREPTRYTWGRERLTPITKDANEEEHKSLPGSCDTPASLTKKK